MATPATPPTPPVVEFLTKNFAVSELTKTVLSIFVVYSAHYTTAKLYDGICVPDGLRGFLFGFVTTASPWCRFLLEIMKLTENQYSAIILVVLSRIVLQTLGI
jgi:hypothetical protein